MKVFYVISDACRLRGGAERAASNMLQRLQERCGYDCQMLSSHPLPYDELRDGVRLRGFRDVEELKTIASAEKPDIVLASLADAVAAFRVGRRYGLPRVLLVHGYEFAPPTTEERRQWLIPDGHRDLPRAEIGFVLDAADHIFTCSQYMRGFLRERTGRDSEVFFSSWDEAEVLVDAAAREQAECITAICGFRHKGIEIFLELARRFPDERFMLVGQPGSDLATGFITEAAACPNVELPGRMQSRDFLARSKLVLVPSQLPEPFGRIAVEAMANDVPVLASRSGGLHEIVGDGPMGVDGFDDIDAWEDCLRAQLAGRRIDPADLERGRAQARAIMAADSVDTLAQTIGGLVASTSPDWETTSASFSGNVGGVESHSLVNAEWSLELAARGYVVDTVTSDKHAIHDHVIVHDYLSNFNDFDPPDTGYCITVRTSDFGPYPPSWAEKIGSQFDQLWVYTEWIAEQARASGIDPAQIRVIPLGADIEVFRPDGPLSPLVPENTFTFLFVGGAVRRKGIDLLIQAYVSAFSSSDDVALIIKGHSPNAFYKGRSETEGLVAVNDRPDMPRIDHIDDHLSREDLAALFRSCDVGVFPYRADGFVLPIAEAMASGTPSIVPNFGPALDFCSPATSFFVPVRRIQLPFSRTFKLALGFDMDIAGVDFCEVRVDALARLLREVFEGGRDALAGKSEAGVRYAREHVNWAASVDRVEACLDELRDAVPRRNVTRRADAARKYRRETAAREMAVDAALARRTTDGSR